MPTLSQNKDQLDRKNYIYIVKVDWYEKLEHIEYIIGSVDQSNFLKTKHFVLMRWDIRLLRPSSSIIKKY